MDDFSFLVLYVLVPGLIGGVVAMLVDEPWISLPIGVGLTMIWVSGLVPALGLAGA